MQWSVFSHAGGRIQSFGFKLLDFLFTFGAGQLKSLLLHLELLELPLQLRLSALSFVVLRHYKATVFAHRGVWVPIFVYSRGL